MRPRLSHMADLMDLYWICLVKLAQSIATINAYAVAQPQIPEADRYSSSRNGAATALLGCAQSTG
jgi:hypothetical protein